MSFDVFSILGNFVDVAPVGSRVTCDPAPSDTDEDYIVCIGAATDADAELKAAGFIAEGEPGFYTGNDNGSFVSYRRDHINIITTPDREFYDLFLTATALAKRFNLLEKSDRIALFQAVLYGVDVHNLERK